MEKLKVTNDRSTFVTLWLEPWGEDYGMLSGDELEVVAVDAAEGFYFHVIADEKNIKVYAEGDVTQIAVHQSGSEPRAETIGAKKPDNIGERGITKPCS